MAHSLAALLAEITPEQMAAALARFTPTEADTLAEHAKARTRQRLAGHPLADDAASVAAVYALALAGREKHADHTAPALARLAAYTAAVTADEEHRTRHEAEQPEGLADDLTEYEEEPAARIHLAALPRPDALALDPSAERTAALALARLATVRPDLADLVALSTYLDPDDGRTWRNGLPSAAPLLLLLGRKATGRNRADLARTVRLAFHAYREHCAALVNHRRAAVTLHPHHGDKRTGAAPHYAGRQSHRADPDALALAHDLTESPACRPLEMHRTSEQRAAGKRGPSIEYGQPRTLPTSGPASLPIVRTPDGTETVLFTTGTAFTVRTDAERASILGALVLPAWRKPSRTRTDDQRGDSERQEADALALIDSTDATARSATAVPGVTPGTVTGAGTVAGNGKPFRAPTPRKRKRDGAIGSSMTRA